MHKIQENVKLGHAILPQLCTNNDSLAGTGVLMRNYEIYGAVVQAGTGMESDIEVTLYESTDDTTYTAISGKVATITSDTETGIAILEVRAEELTVLNIYVQVQATVTTGTETLVSAVNIRTMPRYPQASLAA